MGCYNGLKSLSWSYNGYSAPRRKKLRHIFRSYKLGPSNSGRCQNIMSGSLTIGGVYHSRPYGRSYRLNLSKN